MIRLTWASSAGKRSIDLDGSAGFWRLGEKMPDVQMLRRGSESVLLVRNGLVDPADRAAQFGTLTGHLRVVFGGALLADEDVDLWDGTSFCLARPGPMAPLPDVVVNWLMRDIAGWPKPVMIAVRDYFIGMNPYYGGKPGVRQSEPDAAGSKEMTEYAWRGALGAAFLDFMAVSDPISMQSIRAAAADRTRTGFWTPVSYYDATGKAYPWSSEPDALVDEKGLTSTGHGSFDRPSESPFQTADIEHVTIDGEWADAVLFGSPAAWLLCEHMGEVLASRSLCRSPKTTGNLRGYARTIKALALIVGMYPGKPQFAAALRNAYGGLLAGCGNSDGLPWAVPSPPKDVSLGYTHVAAMPADYAKYGHLSPAEVQEMFRAIICPWAGAALTALGIARDIPDAAKCCLEIEATMQHLTNCLLTPGRSPGSTDNDGLPANPAPFHDSYARDVWFRVKRANLPWKGTMDWTMPGLYASHKAGSVDARIALEAALPKMPDAKIGTAVAVETFWPALGMTK